MKKDYPSIAKITRPALPDVFPRQRLFKLMDEGKRFPVTWITGPPGSGKTTLVASYLDARKLPCLWYQVDEGDGDIASFFYYMGKAAKKAAPRIKKPLPLLTPEYQFGIPTFTRRYFEGLYERLKPPFVLVFDNYQEAPEGSAFHETVVNGLSVLPPGIRVYIVSRAVPPPELTRMQANSGFSLIGWEQLRMTPEETADVMRLRTGKPQSKDSARLLYEKTQGWAAGIVLMEALQTAGGERNDPATMEPGRISDYFAGEIFGKLSEDTRDFLLMTSYFPRFTPAMAGAISGNSRAAQFLAELNRRNYFTERRAGQDLTYQYHAMFREFLESLADRRYSAAERARLMLSAAKLLEKAGQVEDAAELFIKTQDWTGLTHLILNHAQSLAAQGRNRTLEGWLTRIPCEITEADPWLLYWMGISMLHYRPNDSGPLFERAYDIFDRTANAAGVFLSWSGVVDSILLQFDRFSRFDRWLEELEQALKKYEGFPAPDIETQVTLSVFSALDLRKPQHPHAMRWRERMVALAKRNGDVNLEAASAFHAAWHELYIGQPKRSALFLQAVEKSMRSNQVAPLARIMIQLLSAVHCWLQGRNEECQKLISEALLLADASGVHIFDHQTLGSAVTSALSIGDIEHAQKMLQRMEGDSGAMNKAYYYYLAAWCALIRHDLSTAYGLATAGLELAERIEGPFPLAVNSIGAAEIFYEVKAYDESGVQLKRALSIAEEMNSPASLFMCNLVGARISFDRDKDLEGIKQLRNAFAIGRENGYMNMYGWRSDVMSRLCVKALEYGIEVEYARDLIRKRNLMPDAPPLHIDAWPWLLRISTLGKFEVRKDDKPLVVSKKTQKKPLQLLKALIALGGKDVREDRLADLLWPDAEGDAGLKAVNVNTVRLRKLLGVSEAIIVHDGTLTLNPRLCWVDAWTFERMMDEALRILDFGSRIEKAKGPKLKSAIHNPQFAIEKAISLYRGPFLSDEPGPWAVSLREKLRDRFLRCIDTLGAHLEQSKKHKEAITLYQRGIEVDDLAEPYYRRMMNCHISLGSHAEALSVYKRCRKTLAAYGLEPSAETETIRKSLLKQS